MAPVTGKSAATGRALLCCRGCMSIPASSRAGNPGTARRTGRICDRRSPTICPASGWKRSRRRVLYHPDDAVCLYLAPDCRPVPQVDARETAWRDGLDRRLRQIVRFAVRRAHQCGQAQAETRQDGSGKAGEAPAPSIAPGPLRSVCSDRSPAQSSKWNRGDSGLGRRGGLRANHEGHCRTASTRRATPGRTPSTRRKSAARSTPSRRRRATAPPVRSRTERCGDDRQRRPTGRLCVVGRTALRIG